MLENATLFLSMQLSTRQESISISTLQKSFEKNSRRLKIIGLKII